MRFRSWIAGILLASTIGAFAQDVDVEKRHLFFNVILQSQSLTEAR
jgi:hypothetical protein